MGEENQEARLAVAVNDIDWIKESQRNTNRGIEQLQLTLSQHIKDQNERSEMYATKDELKAVSHEVDKLKTWRAWLTGAYVAGAAVITILFEYGKQWFGGTGH